MRRFAVNTADGDIWYDDEKYEFSNSSDGSLWVYRGGWGKDRPRIVARVFASGHWNGVHVSDDADAT